MSCEQEVSMSGSVSEQGAKRDRDDEDLASSEAVADGEGGETADSEEPSNKRSKIEEGGENGTASSADNTSTVNAEDKKATVDILSPVRTRSRGRKGGAAGAQTDCSTADDQEMAQTNAELLEAASSKRWRVHQMAEDYIGMAGEMMYPSTQLRSYGYDPERREYPLENLSLLGFLKSPLRRPSVIESWSPYEIALFEAALFHYGKEFHDVQKVVKTKTTKEIIDFYYVWKKTAHYKKWKEQFLSSHELIELESPVKKGP